MKRRLALLASAALVVLAGAATTATAGVPDGSGPWADFVDGYSQGLRQDGSAVLAARSNPNAALGVAENTAAVDSTFFSLGFGGQVTVGYANLICNGTDPDIDLELVEATREPYPPEYVDVYVSKTGDVGSYVQIATDVNKDATVSLPASMTYARYVRVIDKTHHADFTALLNADGYDVDGIRAIHNTECVVLNNRMTGGGSVFAADGSRVTHGFTLNCDATKTPAELQVNSGGNRFHLTSLTEATCTDDPTIAPNPPEAGFDTYDGKGTGKWNGVTGYTANWTFTDAGEPGVPDTVRIIIRDPSNNVVLSVSGPLDRGNQQAHKGS